MSVQGEHCPFLNRRDVRCSTYFSLDRLGHAFEHCFDQYRTCPTYLELLVERRVRRTVAGEADAKASYAGAPRLIQVTIPHRFHKPVPGPAVVPVAPGL